MDWRTASWNGLGALSMVHVVALTNRFRLLGSVHGLPFRSTAARTSFEDLVRGRRVGAGAGVILADGLDTEGDTQQGPLHGGGVHPLKRM